VTQVSQGPHRRLAAGVETEIALCPGGASLIVWGPALPAGCTLRVYECDSQGPSPSRRRLVAMVPGPIAPGPWWRIVGARSPAWVVTVQASAETILTGDVRAEGSEV
jgi:hypothetical protein